MSQKELVLCPGRLRSSRVCCCGSACGGTSTLTGMMFVVWLHCCALISHTLSSRDAGSCQSSSLFLWPLALFPSLCTSVQSSLAEILNMSCFPDVQGWLSSSLRAVNDAEEPASCWPWSTVPCCLPAPRDGPAQGAPVSLAAMGRAWDSVTAEFGFPRLQEEFSASSQECGQVKS